MVRLDIVIQECIQYIEEGVKCNFSEDRTHVLIDNLPLNNRMLEYPLSVLRNLVKRHKIAIGLIVTPAQFYELDFYNATTEFVLRHNISMEECLSTR